MLVVLLETEDKGIVLPVVPTSAKVQKVWLSKKVWNTLQKTLLSWYLQTLLQDSSKKSFESFFFQHESILFMLSSHSRQPSFNESSFNDFFCWKEIKIRSQTGLFWSWSYKTNLGVNFEYFFCLILRRICLTEKSLML